MLSWQHTHFSLEALQQDALAVRFASQRVKRGVPDEEALPRLALRRPALLRELASQGCKLECTDRLLLLQRDVYVSILCRRASVFRRELA